MRASLSVSLPALSSFVSVGCVLVRLFRFAASSYSPPPPSLPLWDVCAYLLCLHREGVCVRVRVSARHRNERCGCMHACRLVLPAFFVSCCCRLPLPLVLLYSLFPFLDWGRGRAFYFRSSSVHLGGAAIPFFPSLALTRT